MDNWIYCSGLLPLRSFKNFFHRYTFTQKAIVCFCLIFLQIILDRWYLL